MESTFRRIRRAVIAVGLVAAGLVIAPAATTVVHAAALEGGGEVHPLTPARIYDSRTFDGGPINEANPGPRAMPGTFDVSVLGQGGIPTDASKVLAVVVNITVTGSTSPGVLGAYAAGSQPATLTSLLNFKTGMLVSNMAILSPGAGGKISVNLFGGTGTVHVVVDVFGWLSTSAEAAGAESGSRMQAITPARILDTRDGTNVRRGPIGPRESIVVPVRGVDGVNPSATDVIPTGSDVVGVVLNVVGINARSGGAPTYVSAVPNDLGGSAPSTSNLNLSADQIKANLVIVPVGADGNIRLFNLAGQTDVAIDAVGYLRSGADAGSTSGRIVPLAAPFRTFDTREPAFGNAPLGPGVAEEWSFSAFQASVNLNGQYVGDQGAVIGNLTNASLTRQYPTVSVESFLTVWPSGQPRPLTSYLDTNEDPIAVPNMAILTYGTDYKLSVYNLFGSAHYLFDASAVVLK
jgi:hypothetical protein